MLFKTIMEKLSETYRIKTGYGLRPIRNKRELEALIKFCKSDLLEKYHWHCLTNTKHCWVELVTIKMYEEAEDAKELSMLKKFNPYQMYYRDIYDFIEDHVGYYWS